MATAPKPAAKTAPVESNDAAQANPKKSGKKTILIVMIAVVLLAVAGAAAYFMMGGEEHVDDPDAPAAAHAVAKVDLTKPPIFMVIEPFTVNLQREASAGDQFLQISFTLQLTEKNQEELMKVYLPQARSRLLLLLSGKKGSDISTPDGKKKLAEEIMTQLRVPFTTKTPPLEITDVFFTSFVIQ